MKTLLVIVCLVAALSAAMPPPPPPTGGWVSPPAEAMEICFDWDATKPKSMMQGACYVPPCNLEHTQEWCWIGDAAVPMADCPCQETGALFCYDEHRNPHSCPATPGYWLPDT